MYSDSVRADAYRAAVITVFKRSALIPSNTSHVDIIAQCNQQPEISRYGRSH